MMNFLLGICIFIVLLLSPVQFGGNGERRSFTRSVGMKTPFVDNAAEKKEEEEDKQRFSFFLFLFLPLNQKTEKMKKKQKKLFFSPSG